MIASRFQTVFWFSRSSYRILCRVCMHCVESVHYSWRTDRIAHSFLPLLSNAQAHPNEIDFVVWQQQVRHLDGKDPSIGPKECRDNEILCIECNRRCRQHHHHKRISISTEYTISECEYLKIEDAFSTLSFHVFFSSHYFLSSFWMVCYTGVYTKLNIQYKS